MYKIKEIKLENFKFFFGEEIIKLDCKNVLLFGENGSGKSSIYWALHCFLHSTLKPDTESVKKYFLPLSRSKESIRNRYADDDSSSAIHLTLAHSDHQNYADITVEISNDVVNARTEDKIRLMALSSELINYKVIYNMYVATNRSTIKLFDYFCKNLMEFIYFDMELTSIYGERISRVALDWWEYIKKGMRPYTTMNDPNYSAFQSHVDLFNEKLHDFLQLITTETNRSLQEDFGEDFTIEFRYRDATFNDFNKYNKGRNRRTIAPEIELIVHLTNFQGEKAIVERPQSYLNEARLSSIAIAIRLAILKERYIEDAPRVMVLDDMLLSLDMGNRSAILKMLLKNYLSRYQIIIMTHDRVFFDCVLNHLPENVRQSDWKVLEIYERQENDKKVPSIVNYKDALTKAYSYFKGEHCPIDYNACGNSQRQALEEIFKNQFQAYSLRKQDNELVNTEKLMLADCISKSREMYQKIGFETDVLDELDIHLKQSLNPSSHHNPQSNFYKKEIERTFEIIEVLRKHKIVPLVSKDEVITLSIKCTDDTECVYEIQLLDDILMYQKPNNDYFLNDDDKRIYVIKSYNGSLKNNKTSCFSLQELYDDTIRWIKKCLHKDVIPEKEVGYIYSYQGQNLIERLNEINNN